jgi:hypothetical protein
MKPKSKLRLESTGQYLAVPLVGSHDNAEPVSGAVDRCLGQLERISGH